MRPEIARLVELGGFPSEEDATLEFLRQAEETLRGISQPLSNVEARALVGLFGPDSCFGLAWSVLHLVETAPGWPLQDCLENSENEWITLLRDRAVRGGLL